MPILREFDLPPTAALQPATPPALCIRRLGDAQDRVVTLQPGKWTIGSSPQCQVRLTGPRVRPLQCVVRLDADAAVVTRWATGVLLNGSDFSTAPLHRGDRLAIDQWELLFEPGDLPTQRAEAAEEPFGSPDVPQPATDQPAWARLAHEALHDLRSFHNNHIQPAAAAPSGFDAAAEAEATADAVDDSRPAVAAGESPTATNVASQLFADRLILQLWTANHQARRRAKQLVNAVRAARFQADSMAADLSAMETELDLARAAYDCHLAHDEQLSQELTEQRLAADERIAELSRELEELREQLAAVESALAAEREQASSLASEAERARDEAAASALHSNELQLSELEAALASYAQQVESLSERLSSVERERDQLAATLQSAELARDDSQAALQAAEWARSEEAERLAASRQEQEQLAELLRSAQSQRDALAEQCRAEAERAATWEQAASAATHQPAPTPEAECAWPPANTAADSEPKDDVSAADAHDAEPLAAEPDAWLPPVDAVESSTPAADPPEGADWSDVEAPDYPETATAVAADLTPAFEAAPADEPAPSTPEDDARSTPFAIEPAPAPEFTPPSFIEQYRHLLEEPAAAPMPATPARPTLDDEYLSPAKAQAHDGPAEESDEALEAYMASLMKRMRGASSADPRPTYGQPAPALPAPSPEEADAPAPLEPFDFASQMQATRKTPLSSDLAALREIANNSARRAIASHSVQRQFESALSKFVIALTATVSAAYLMASAPAMSNWQFWAGVGAGAAGIGAAMQVILIEHRRNRERRLAEAGRPITP